MGAWIVELEGTDAGRWLAVSLALTAAVAHAVFGSLQKGRHDPWLTRGAIDVSYAALAVPLILIVPWPEPFMWPIFAGMMVIHIGYKWLQAMAYTRGAFTVVYPVVRGTGPLATVIAASLVFGEAYSGVQWSGVALLTGAIFGLAALNVAQAGIADRGVLLEALLIAFACGGMVAAYTTYDAVGIRATADPFTFLAWFFFLDGLVFPVLAWRRWHRMAHPPAPGPLMLRGVAGGVIAYLSFGSVMLATRLDKVGEAAVIRETSVVFAGLIGWLFLGERLGPARWALLALIAAGAVIVEAG